MVQQTPASARQLVSRARKHLADRPRARVGGGDQRRLLDAFLTAARAGDLTALESLLTEDAVSYSDGGGRVRAARYPLVGRERVAKVIRAFADRFWIGATVTPLSINGQAAAVLSRDGTAYAVIMVSAGPDGIDRLHWQLNPEKLSQLPTVRGSA